MWVLQNSKDCDIRYYLIEGQEYTVGRRDCKILILNDSSVSRNHAQLKVTHSDANLSKPLARPLLTFHDSSKFGSLRNGTKLASSSTPLEDGDLIVFGAMNSNEWRVKYEPLVVAFSSLPSAEKKSLKLLTRKLGGHVVPEWSKECTYLIMTQLTVTIKVIGALVTCRHIVTPEFLRKIEEAAVADSKMPDPLNYPPTLTETTLNEKDVSFMPNADRQTLFKGKTVVFLTAKQLKQLGQTVELAGGKPVLIDEGMTRSEEKLLTDPSTIVLYADPQDQSQIMTQAGQEWAVRVMDILKRSDLRPIPQSELGLAVLYASTEVHCNPQVAQAGLTLLHPVAAPSLTQDVLAPQTQPSELPHSDAKGTRKASSVRIEQQEKPLATGPERSSKKRVREEDTSKSTSLSKLPRKESGKPPDREQPPSTSITGAIKKNAAPIKSKGSVVSNAPLEMSSAGKSASEQTSGSKEKFETVDLTSDTSDTESKSMNERDLSKQASQSQKRRNTAAGMSSQKHSPEGLTKADTPNTSKNGDCGSGSDGDLLSPSERVDKTTSRSLRHNPNPQAVKQAHKPEGLTKAIAPNTSQKGDCGSGSDGDLLSPTERVDKTTSRSLRHNPNPHTVNQAHKPEVLTKADAPNTFKKDNSGSGFDGDLLSPSEQFDETTSRSLRHNPNPHAVKQGHKPQVLTKADAPNTSKKGDCGSGSDRDLLSPSERVDKTTSRSLRHNPNPHAVKQSHVSIENKGGIVGRTLSQDDVIPPSERRDERMMSGRSQATHHPHGSGPNDQSVKKGQEVAGADSEEDIKPPSRKTNVKTTNRNVGDNKSVSLARNSALEPQGMVTKKEPLEGGTITEDVLPPTGGNNDRGRRAGKRRREDLVAVDTEDASKKREVTEEGSGMNKSKKSRFVKEDYEGSNAATDPEPSHDAANPPLQEIPTGFITANKNIKCEPSSPLDPTLPYNLAIVEQVGLVIRVAKVPQTREKTDAKNFKKFKKASYVGQFSMPRIIGGSDLYHSETRQLAEARAAMAEERKTIQKEREQKDLADDLFNWEPRPMKRRR